MFSLPYIISGVIGLSGAILLVLSVVDWWYVKKREKELENTASEYTGTISKDVQKAHEKAEKIISHAVIQAEHTISEAKIFKEDLVTDLNKSLHQVAEETIVQFKGQTKQFEKQFELMFQSLQQEYQAKSHGALQSIEQIVQKELDDFREILKRETFSSQQIISTRVQDEFMNIQKEILTYRESKYKEVDETVKKLIKHITQDTLGRSLTNDDHEKLILESLEKAKKEGVFNS